MSSKNFIARSAPSAHPQGHHRLVGGIDEFEPEFDEPHIRPAARGTSLEHSGSCLDPIAWAYRRKPLHLLHARRTHEACVADEAVGEHAHENAAAVPTRRDQTAEQSRTRGGLVEMHGLR